MNRSPSSTKSRQVTRLVSREKRYITHWEVVLEGSRYQTLTYMGDGLVSTSVWWSCEATNIGEIDETTAEEEAAVAVHNLINDKITRAGYKFPETEK